MDAKIRALENLQEQIDAESLYLVKQQQKQLQNVESALMQKQTQLSIYENQLHDDKNQIDVLNKTLTNQVQKKDQIHQQLNNAQIENINFRQNLQMTAEQNNILKSHIQQLERENQNILNNAVQQNMNADFLEQQAKQFQVQKQKLIQAMQIQESALKMKDGDIQKLAVKCKQMLGDNEKLAQKSFADVQKTNQIAGTCKKLLKDNYMLNNKLNQQTNVRNFTQKQMERCLDNNLLIKRALGANKTVLKLQAFCKCVLFIKFLKQNVKNGVKNGKYFSQLKQDQEAFNKIGKLENHELIVLQNLSNPLKELNIRQSELLSNQQVGYLERAVYEDPDKLLQLEKKIGKKLTSDLVKQCQEVGKQQKQIAEQTTSQQNKQQTLIKENQKLQTEVSKQISEIAKLDSANQLLEEKLNSQDILLTDQNKKLDVLQKQLIQQERELKQQNAQLDISNKDLTSQNIQLKSQLQSLSNALDAKQREHLRLNRDFERVNARVKNQFDEVQNTRNVIGQVVGDQVLEEKKRRLKQLEEKMQNRAME